MSLDAVFAGIQEAHAHKLAKSQEAYVALVRRLHENPDALDAEPGIVVNVLDEVGKTPDALKADLERYRKLRELHGHVARHAPASEEYEEVRKRRNALRDEWKELEKSWAERLRDIDREAYSLQAQLARGVEAEHDLLEHQNVGEACRELGRQGRHAEASALREGAGRLEYLAKAFFPPSPSQDSRAVRYEGSSVRVGQRGR